MLSSFKRLAVTLGAATALFTFAPAVQADPFVTFSVTGKFDASALGSNAIVSDDFSSVSIGGTPGDGTSNTVINTTLSYTETGPISFDLGAAEYANGGYQIANVSFGSLSLTSTDPNAADNTRERYRMYDGLQLTLMFEQLAPVYGTHPVVTKSIRGTVWYSEIDPLHGTGSYLSITFAEPLVFTIPGGPATDETITYTFLTPKVRINNPTGAGTSSASIAGQVSAAAAPLPAVAWGGLALMGAFGGVRGLRRFRRGAALAA